MSEPEIRYFFIRRPVLAAVLDNFDFDMHLYGWGGAATDPGFTLTAVLHSRDGQGRGGLQFRPVRRRRATG